MSIHVQESLPIREKGILRSIEQELLTLTEQGVQVMLVPEVLHIQEFLPERAQEISQVITLVTIQDHLQENIHVGS